MSRNNTNDEQDPLLANGQQNRGDDYAEYQLRSRATLIRTSVWGALTILVALGLVIVFVFEDRFAEWSWSGTLPKNPTLAALKIMDIAPVIDGHIDLPMLVRYTYANNVSAVDLESRMPGQVDIPRLRAGRVGGFFWSVFVPCPDETEEDKDFLSPSWVVRDALEQIDVARLLIEKYPNTFQFARSSEDIKYAISQGKIASLMGLEGAHHLGNSIAVLRQYYSLGVRYVTLTHTCHNAFADSCGFAPGIKPLHHGLSSFGLSLVAEMNRLGILVDLSHTSDATAAQALNYSRAPVIWSHSDARAVWDHPRNVPDDVLGLIGIGEGKKDAVVMVNFASFFLAEDGKSNVEVIANHVEHISKAAGKKHVGIGSDFDGISDHVPRGLEDVSKYPALIAELYKRGWDKYELAGLTGANLLRVLEGAEKVSRELKAEGAEPAMELYGKRGDLPIPRWDAW